VHGWLRCACLACRPRAPGAMRGSRHPAHGEVHVLLFVFSKGCNIMFGEAAVALKTEFGIEEDTTLSSSCNSWIFIVASGLELFVGICTMMSAYGPMHSAAFRTPPSTESRVMRLLLRPAFFLGKSTRTNINFKKYVIIRFCSCENTLDLVDLQNTLDWS
jgi:hypothetical protein